MKSGMNPATLQKFQELEASSAARPVIAHLRRLVAEGSDLDCYKINAFRIAKEAGVSPLEAVRAFLFATRLGITDLSWDIHCPSCKGVPDYQRHLMQLQNRAHCGLCDLN